MTLITPDLISFAHTLADLARDEITPLYRNLSAIEVKSDQSPVTIADRNTEQALRKHITSHYPEHGIIGEEFGAERSDAEYVWTLDPIDGTTSFIIGRPTFGTLIALTYQGKPVLGIIDQAISKERWIGVQGQGTFFNEQPIHTNATTTSLAHAKLCTTAPYYFDDTSRKRFDHFTHHIGHTIYGGDCYSYGLLAMGQVDIVIESQLKIHDFMALAIIIEEAGGVFSDWNNQPITLQSDGNIIASGNTTLHTAVLNHF